MSKRKLHETLVFWGTSDFAVPTLEALIAKGTIPAAVVTVPDKPVGRQRRISASPIKKAALAHGIPVLQPASLRDDAFLGTFTSLRPDICLVVAYGKIIPERYLLMPRFGFLNVHPSLLPAYRGPSPIQSAILNGEQETGVSIMLLDKETDHGPILASAHTALDPYAYYPELASQLADLAAQLAVQTLSKWLSGKIEPKEQNHSQASFTKLLTRQDGLLDWSKPAEQLYNRIRALALEPGTWTHWENKILNIHRCRVLPVRVSHEDEPGQVVQKENKTAVATGTFYLAVEEVQLEGSKPMKMKAFLNGHPDFIGSKLE